MVDKGQYSTWVARFAVLRVINDTWQVKAGSKTRSDTRRWCLYKANTRCVTMFTFRLNETRFTIRSKSTPSMFGSILS